MARKNILQGLLNPSAAPEAAPSEPAAPLAELAPRSNRGAIGAVSRSIADLKSRSVIEIDPHLIEAGGMHDRLESDSEADAALLNSIAEYGQQVPVLVRPHPQKPGRYQIVYGRRRVLAMRDLGQEVKALVRLLDDRELVMAQGQENTARRDLSFIEKVNFARQLQEAGYERKVILDALSIDKTLLSRMLSVAERLPPETIAAIGAAPSIGRDRWLGLAEMLTASATDPEELAAMIDVRGTQRSDDRFQVAWDFLEGRLLQPEPKAPKAPRPPAAARPDLVSSRDGKALGQMRRDKNFLTLKLRRAQTAGFEDWLVQHLPELFETWQNRRPEDS